ncbi:MAG: 2-hydroxyacyl-CoA dehydratase [Clostridia bacterium]|nr:2-hydroxyacyl-CoA dehydratase [Clostridia bacterium]
MYKLGIDVGSTTVKIVVIDQNKNIVFKRYQRHFADVRETLISVLEELEQEQGDLNIKAAVTGSGGLNLAKKLGIEFVQEVIAVKDAVLEHNPNTDVVIELGGEDAKIIYLTGGVEQRMNGICAGGTGAFIDQMAALLQTDAAGLNEYAKGYKEIYQIAARCGVFAKSDIQPLINDGASREDLAESIFQSVVNQTISGLACGRRIKGNVAFLGGPLTFLSELKKTFIRTLDLSDDEVIAPENSHLYAAYGTAMAVEESDELALSSIIDKLKNIDDTLSESNRLPRLFEDEEDYKKFLERQSAYKVERGKLEDYQGLCYLGVDAGSTTSKLVLLSEDEEIIYSYYNSNKGNPIEAIKEAFKEIKALNPNVKIAYSCSTGYGETLLQDAMNLDCGEVETIAHYYAAKYFKPEVNSIIDIGGQDMKCIKIKNNSVEDIILNEACSSGCGSFIESFANSLGYSAEEFAALGVKGESPIDLGTRCTVFMNSNVKQAQKEGAAVEDIAAGLAYSVIKNALFKVIKLADAKELGENIVVQGGTFYNDSVLRAFELVAGVEVVRPEIAGLMGAFGAALIAKERWEEEPGCDSASTILSIDEILGITYSTSSVHCKGCTNGCKLTINKFSNGNRHISGNRCEVGLGNAGVKEELANIPNLFKYKLDRLFGYKPLQLEEAPMGVIGIPRVLNMFEDFPYWAVLFRELGFRVELSPYSSPEIYATGMDSIPSESECYPAKLAHGHVQWLINQGIKDIFYPCVFYERIEDQTAQNHFNCPMVMSYPENIKNNLDDIEEKGVNFMNPFIAFTDRKTITEAMIKFMGEQYGLDKLEVKKASNKAWDELLKFRRDVHSEGRKAIKWIKENDGQGIVLAGRPYHLDPEINHGIPEMIQSYGFAVLTEDSVSAFERDKQELRVTNQWMYHARLYRAAEYVSKHNRLNLIQLNSFGCGVDAVTVDQVQEIMASKGKLYTLIKIDEVNNLGAARIRVRSLIAAMRMRTELPKEARKEAYKFERVEYTKEMQDQKYTLLCPNMSPYHFDFFEAAFIGAGYNIVLMRNDTQHAKDLGVKYVNNDVCYPATITTGQIMDEVLSGKYDTHKLAIIMSQTGGGCRASNYVGFIRKALREAGYDYIPVVSVNLNGMEKNSGFSITPRVALKAAQGALYGDLFMRMVLHTRPYEVNKGETDALHEKWKKICYDELLQKPIRLKHFYNNCKTIIDEFDAIEVDRSVKKPKVGIVGEILVKYMPFANNYLSDLLEGEGAEVVIPDLIGFMEYCFLDNLYKEEHLGGTKSSANLGKMGLDAIKAVRKPIEKKLKASKNFSGFSNIWHIGEAAEQILQRGNQCGEGWFLTGEIIELIEDGTPNVVCIQPFGCLPNHIVGKGIFKKTKELYPEANLVAIDYDPSASQVNQLNRLKLMLSTAKENLEKE